MRPTAQEIATALGAKSTGECKWRARCPAHDDHTPSLTISIGRSGAPLVKCWSGCSQEAVIEALRARGLWSSGGGRPRVRSVPGPVEALWLRVLEFLAEGPALAAEQLRELDQLLADAEAADDQSPYIVVGQILEDAARVTYHCVSRVAEALNERGAQRAVDRWMNERYPDALFEPRS